MSKLFLVLATGVLALTGCSPSSSSSELSSSASSSSSEESSMSIPYDQDLPTFFKTSATSSFTIDKNIYGTFIEHIESCVYGGIWSELIMDRKFVVAVETDVSQWKKTGSKYVDDVTTNVYSGDHSTLIHEGSGIYQNGIHLDAKDYSGYLYAKGSGTLVVTLSNTKETLTKTISINSPSVFTKYSYSFTSTYKNAKTKITVSSTKGDITVDSLSLMPADNYRGMRRDTLDKLKELNATFYRWPGGNFVSGYDWRDGIGNRDERPTERNLNYAGLVSSFSSNADRLASDLVKIGNMGFYGVYDPNDFGLDEFITMCRYLGAEPNIVVNSGLGDSEMASDEVEYCNATSGEYASKRQQKDPYAVTYWSIGNEMNGDWQLGHVSAAEYVVRHNEFASAMKAVDSSIALIAVGDNSSSWSQKMVDSCSNNMDYLSEHYYAIRDENDVTSHIKSMHNQATYRIKNHRELTGVGSIKMAIDEYAYNEAYMASRLKDGMGIASALNCYIANGDIVKIACYSSTVNATQGSVVTDNYSAYLEGNGYVLKLYRENMQDHYLPINIRTADVEDGYVEISSTISADKKTMTISVINASDKSYRLTNDSFDKVTKIEGVTGSDYEAINSSEGNGLQEFSYDNPTDAVASARSVSLITISLK